MPAKTSSTNYFSASAISALIYLWCAFGLHSAPAIDSLHLELYLSYNDIQSVYAHGDTLWAGTRHGGIARSIVSDSSFIHYNTSDGLSDNNVNRVIPADSVGAVWAATDNGFSYVTDSYIKSYHTANSVQLGQVYNIAATGKRVAVGCTGGLLVIYNNGQIELTKRFETVSSPIVVYGKDSALWVVGPLNLYKVINSELIKVDVPLEIDVRFATCISVDSAGNLWLLESDHTIARFDGTNWEIFTITDDQLTHNTNILYVDPEGNPVAVGSQGISKYENGKWHLVMETNRVVRDITMPDTGIFIVSTTSATKPMVLPPSSEPCFWPEKMGIENNRIKCIAIDKKDNLYVATYQKMWGIHRFNGTEWKYYSTGAVSQLVDNSMNAYAQDSMGGHWFGHENGLTYQLNGTWKSYRYHNELKLERINDLIISHDNELWAACFGRVLNYNHTSWTVFDTSQGLPHHNITAIAELSDSTIIAGTSKGIAYKQGERFSADLETSDWRISSLTFFDNEFLITTTSEGVFIKKDRWEKVLDERYGNDSESDNDGRIWIATTGNGIVITDTTGDILHTFKIADNIGYNVQNIVRGKDGRMWIGSSQGLAAVTIFSSSTTNNNSSQKVVRPSNPKHLRSKIIGVFDLKGRRIVSKEYIINQKQYRSASGAYISTDEHTISDVFKIQLK